MIAREILEAGPGGRMPQWPRSRWACALRAIVQWIALVPLVRLLCRPAVVRGREHVPGDPVVFVANHASHADTAMILSALPVRVRRRTAVCAAADYFFRCRALGAIVSLLTGAFPFPRRGGEGLERARRLLDEGWSVVLFPEGTRSTDGAVGPFRSGVGALAAGGATIVPVGISGTADVLPKGRAIPRRAPVAVVFGDPVRFPSATPPGEIAARVRDRVSSLAARAALLRPARIPTWQERAGAFARSPWALALTCCWGFAEAIYFPIVPDVAVVLLAAAAPARFVPLALAATVGSVTGGAAAYALGPVAGGGILEHAPLVADRMAEAAGGWLDTEGATGLRHQPWSGVPYKVFGLQAADAGVGFGPFALASLGARGMRILGTAAVAATLGFALRPLLRRAYGMFAIVFAAVFAVGLSRVVAVWS